MGMSTQQPEDPAQQQRSVALRLMNQKDRIEAQIEHQLSVLRMNESTMQSPLLDPEGFPRADIDIVSVRNVNSHSPSRTPHLLPDFVFNFIGYLFVRRVYA